MDSGPRPRRPIKVVILVIAYWIVGNVLQSAFGWLLMSAGLLDARMDGWIGLVLGWGLLFVISFVYREPLDDWLRS